MMKKLLWMILFGTLTINIIAGNGSNDKEIKKKVNELLEKMTLEEKVGQMTQVTLEVVSDEREPNSFINKINEEKLKEAIQKYHVGSILNCGGAANTLENWQEMIDQMQKMAVEETRLGIPIIYGIDAIHGVNYTKDATLFPQNITMAASGSRELVRKSAEITAIETRASGIPWNFNPVLGLGREPLWPRFWETFGEDSYLASVLGREYIEGLQGNDMSDRRRVAACMKHYIGYSVPKSGRDRTPAWIPDRMLKEIFIPPFKAAIDAGCMTVMINSSEINGIPIHSSKYYLKDILRDELGFEGFVVSDWNDINNLYTREMVAKDQREAVKMAVMAGIDMSMVPMDYSFFNHLVDLVKSGEVPEERINEAVRDILLVKFKLGLFERPFTDKSLASEFNKDEYDEISRIAAEESITLLKNENDILPLDVNSKILVTGPCADMLSALNGGWTITWQGNNEELYPEEKNTILEALQGSIGEENVLYEQGVDFYEEKDINKAVQKANESDVIVACIGEPAYCESEGNINDLMISAPQIKLVKELQKTGKPVVLVLVEGRPRILNSIVNESDAILMAYLPGMEGGNAISNILFGEVNPSGKLPFCYPMTTGGITTYDRKPSEDVTDNITGAILNNERAIKENHFAFQWEFGHGLSYTDFEYEELTLNKSEIKKDDEIKISVKVTNTGLREGKEIVQLYLSDLVATVTPSVKRLNRFKKINLKPNETKVVEFVLNSDDYKFIGRDNKPVIEPGEFKVAIADLNKTFQIK